VKIEIKSTKPAETKGFTGVDQVLIACVVTTHPWTRFFWPHREEVVFCGAPDYWSRIGAMRKLDSKTINLIDKAVVDQV